jgi:hypothetical protein
MKKHNEEMPSKKNVLALFREYSQERRRRLRLVRQSWKKTPNC